jgi:hypothetical protein
MTKLITDAGSQVDVPEEKAARLLAAGHYRRAAGATPAPARTPDAGTKPDKGKPLVRLQVPELKEKAVALGIDVDGMRKPELVAAIEAKLEQPPAPSGSGEQE